MHDTELTTISMTAVRVSKRRAHETLKSPETIQLSSGTVTVWPASTTSMNTNTDSTADAATRRDVTSWAALSPITRPNRPAMAEPSSGRKTIAACIRLALHPVDVFDGDGPAVTEEHHDDGQADRGFSRGDGQHEHGEDLSVQIPQEMRKRDEIDIDCEQDQLDRHHDDDDVLAVQEDAEHAQREQDAGDGQVVRKADGQHLDASPARHFDDFHGRLLGARVLLGDHLLAHAGTGAVRQHDRANHRHQQDKAGSLEQERVISIEQT